MPALQIQPAAGKLRILLNMLMPVGARQVKDDRAAGQMQAAGSGGFGAGHF
jgi:hypothetical protein